MNRHTGVRGPEDRVVARVAISGWTARTGLSLVARQGDIGEVDASGALEQVASGGGHVAQLPRGPGQQRPGEQGVALPNQRVGSNVSVADHGTDPHRVVRLLAN